jgi:hypothetical protein
MKAYINTKNSIKNKEKKCPFGFIKWKDYVNVW